MALSSFIPKFETGAAQHWEFGLSVYSRDAEIVEVALFDFNVFEVKRSGLVVGPQPVTAAKFI